MSNSKGVAEEGKDAPITCEVRTRQQAEQTLSSPPPDHSRPVRVPAVAAEYFPISLRSIRETTISKRGKTHITQGLGDLSNLGQECTFLSFLEPCSQLNLIQERKRGQSPHYPNKGGSLLLLQRTNRPGPTFASPRNYAPFKI